MEFERQCDGHHKKAKLIQIYDIFLTFGLRQAVGMTIFRSAGCLNDQILAMCLPQMTVQQLDRIDGPGRWL
jgi:hypothetical protein